MKPYAYNVNEEREVDLQRLFGDDVDKLLTACENIFKNWLHPYEGCYRGEWPSYLLELRKTMVVPEGSTIGKESRKALARWYEEHPEEKVKEDKSRKNWEEHRDKQFRIVYGVAKRHGLHIYWYGNSSPCYGDQFEIYKNHQRVGRIYCC